MNMPKYSGIMGDSPSHISLNNKFDKSNTTTNDLRKSGQQRIAPSNLLSLDTAKK